MSHKSDFLEKCLVLDTETTSDNYSIAKIIEAGFVIREGEDWTIFQELHNPGFSIPPKIISICYITDSMIEGKPDFVDVKDTFQSVVDGFSQGYVIAHNYMYDMKVLENNGIDLSKSTPICTWRMAKKLFNGVESITETNLPFLRFALGLDVPLDMYCHRAGNDSYITAKLLEVLVGLMEESGIIDIDKPYGPQIVAWANEPIIYELWPIGKYKGYKFSDIPKSYWSWAINNIDSLNSDADNFDNDLYQSLALYLNNED